MRTAELQFELKKKKFQLQVEQIFISKRIYQFIDKCTTYEEVLETIRQKLQSAVKKLDRDITQEDIIGLTKLNFEQIAKYNVEESQKNIEKLTEEINKMKEYDKNDNWCRFIEVYVSGATIVDSFNCFYDVKEFICNFTKNFSWNDEKKYIQKEFYRFLTILNFAINHSKFLEDPRNIVCTAVPRISYDPCITYVYTEYLVISKVDNNGVTRIYSSIPYGSIPYNHNNDDYCCVEDNPGCWVTAEITKEEAINIILKINENRFISPENSKYIDLLV